MALAPLKNVTLPLGGLPTPLLLVTVAVKVTDWLMTEEMAGLAVEVAASRPTVATSLATLTTSCGLVVLLVLK